jgi:hypothetical protein
LAPFRDLEESRMADALRSDRLRDPSPSDAASADRGLPRALRCALLAGAVALIPMLLPAQLADSPDEISGVWRDGVAATTLE